MTGGDLCIRRVIYKICRFLINVPIVKVARGFDKLFGLLRVSSVLNGRFNLRGLNGWFITSLRFPVEAGKIAVSCQGSAASGGKHLPVSPAISEYPVAFSQTSTILLNESIMAC